ncbi:zinc finger protein 622-like [Homarus americanus]|uniref:Zinc finger protein 622-like n=1 Tax=Homarus americanus TaxID=6706 RepID=A0A8J5TKQ4_HOMAM|nr:zinc finger protein 622-like [Homarus americanus]KAG7177599.1 Zinc finger protein 622-like [Homarus americanus]
MATFTCLSCHVVFVDGDGQRDHFRSDWHRYNLMRKVAVLPPVSRETYNERVVQAQGNAQQATTNAHEKIPCRPCKKTFTSQNAYDNHLKSKKHSEVVVAQAEEIKNKKNKGKQRQPKPTEEDDEEDDEDTEVEEVDSDEWEGDTIELLDCLFCSHHSDTLEDELHHMTEKHSFFVPDLEFCVDVSGLITYLGEKIGCGFECLACKWRARRCPTLDSIRKHMVDKGHRKIVLDGDTLLEYAEFYDYSSSYPDAGEGAAGEEEVHQTVLTGDGYELVLPSGACIGHRSLRRYYRQKIDPNHLAVVLKKKPGAAFPSVMAKYRSLGWNGATRADIVRKSRDLKFMHRLQNKQQMKLGVRANKLFVTRPQNPV